MTLAQQGNASVQSNLAATLSPVVWVHSLNVIVIVLGSIVSLRGRKNEIKMNVDDE